MLHRPISTAAYARYRAIDVAAQVEGASPHALIAVLFEELVKTLDTITIAAAGGDFSRRNAAQARALSLLHGLEDGLDVERGGEIARSLGAIYAEARRLVTLPTGEGAPGARAMIADIAGAWAAIG